MTVLADIGWLELELQAAEQAKQELARRNVFKDEGELNAFLKAFEKNRKLWTPDDVDEKKD